MVSLVRSRRAFLALLAASTAPAFAGDEDPREKGARLLAEARRAAGADKVKLRDYELDMTTRLSSQKGPVEVASHVQLIVPDVFRQEVSSPSGKVTLIFDGDRAFQRTPAGERPLPAAAVETQRQDLSRTHILFGPAPDPADVRYRRKEALDGRTVDVVEIADLAGAVVRLYIDRETKRVLKQMWVGDVPGGGMAQVEELYSDFQEVGGILWPMSKRVLRNSLEAVAVSRRNMRINVGLQRSDLLQ